MRIHLYYLQGSILNNCIIQGGGAGANGSLIVQSPMEYVTSLATVSITNCTIQNSVSCCIAAYTTLTTTNLFVSSCQMGIYIGMGSSNFYDTSAAPWLNVLNALKFYLNVANSIIQNCIFPIYVDAGIYGATIMNCLFSNNQNIVQLYAPQQFVTINNSISNKI